LPGHITSGEYAYTVHLERFGTGAMETFVKIERPEWWLTADALAAKGWITIGAFYDLVEQQLRAANPPFRGGSQLPAQDNPGPGRLVSIASLDDALAGLRTIVHQGEGHRPETPPDPESESDDDHEVAHLDRFTTISGYLTDRLDPATDVYRVVKDPSVAKAKYSEAQLAANQAFNVSFTEVVNGLQAAMTSPSPEVFGPTTRAMTDLAHRAAFLRAQGLVAGTDQEVAGPTFEYLGPTGRARTATVGAREGEG
jgi:hypothetical protein